MNRTETKILVLEDSPTDAFFLQHALEKDPFNLFSVTLAERLVRGLHLLKQQTFDVLLLDLGLPDSQGLATFNTIHQAAPALPIVIFSGNMDEQNAIEAVRAGAQDYLVKDANGFELAGRAIRYAIERHKLAQSLRQSEARAQGMLSALPDLMFRLNRKGVFLDYRADVHDLYSQSSEIIGKRNRDIAPPEFADLIDAKIQATLESGLLQTFEYQLPIPARGWRDYEARMSPSGDDEVIAVVRDITEAKKAALALQTNEERLRLILETASDGFWIVNAQARFLEVNQAYCTMSGYTREEFLQMGIEDVEEKESAKETAAHVQKILLEGNDQFETRHRRKDGTIFDVEVSVSLLAQDSGPLMICFCRNITQRKQTEQAIYHYNAQLATVVEIEHALAASLNAKHLMEILAQGVWKLFSNLAVVFVSSFDAERQMIKAEYGLHHGAPIEVATLPEIPLAPSGLGTQSQVIHTRQPLIIQANFKEKIQTKILVEIGDDPQDTESALYVPMLAQDQILGLVQLQSYSPNQFTEEDAQVLGLVANTAAVALQNARLYALEQKELAERKKAEQALRASEEKYRKLAQELEDRVRERTAEVQDLYDNAPIGYHSLDPEGKFILINQTELAWFGYAREEVLGYSVKDFLTPMSIAKFNENFPAFKKRGWLKNLELEFIRKDGTTFIALVNATIVYDQQGTYQLSRSTLQDITDRKAAEIALRESEASLQDFLETASDLIQRIDEHGRYTYVNRAWCNRLGYAFEEALQMDMFQLVTPVYHAHCREVLVRLSQSGKSQTLEIAFQTKSGATILVEGGMSIHRDANGQLTANGIFRDVTLRKQAEETLRQSRDELRAANAALEQAARLKDEFLANMSHELRTPLNAVLAFSEGLLEQYRGPLNEHQLTSVRNIEASGRHLLTLINDILDLSKVEAGRMDLQRQPVSIADICEASLLFVKETATKKALKLAYQLDDHLAILEADPKRLKQMLVNLLSNAVKFTPQGGQVRLDVKANADAGIATFAITDTGIGIAEQDLSQLFQPFTQLDSKLNRQHEGTGLGLALVRRLVEMHGGSITVESIPGEGSCFTLALPYQPFVRQKASPHPEVPSTRGYPRTALLVDDSESVAEQITRYLSAIHVQATVHMQGLGVLEQVEALQPGVILLDLLMPGQSGWEVLAQLKANPRTCTIPVIIISVAEERSRGLAAGAAEYLVKPIVREALYAVLREVAGVPENGRPAFLVVPPSEHVRILLAEDNELSIQAMSDYLEAKGYKLTLARNGWEALQKAREWQPHLILMDIQMPEMDGLEAIQHLRANHAFRDVPIIALTALAMPGDRESCLAAGANAYLSKPVKLKELVTHIQNLLAAQNVLVQEQLDETAT